MKNASAQVNITINGKELQVDEGISILLAARQNDIYIPTLCHHPALSEWGGCRLCIVEVDGSPKLAASCVTPVRAGMSIVTNNDRIVESRRTILEFLFAERNHNCMFCPRSGECELQRLAYELQMDHLTVAFSFKEFPTDVTSRYMAIDHNRCILCGRCIRACQEIAGAHVLGFHHRGPKTMIGMDLKTERSNSTCMDCGVCMQVCPTGAISNRFRSHYAVKGHAPTSEKVESFCSLCGLMCPTDLYASNNQLIRVDGRLSKTTGRPDKGQLCYKGRFQVFQAPAGRLTQPMVRQPDGAWEVATWKDAIQIVAGKMADIQKKNSGKALFGITSGMVSNEELILFKELMEKGWSAGYVDTLDGRYFRNLAAVYSKGNGAIAEASWKTIGESDFVLIVGGNPVRTQPLLTSLLRKRNYEENLKLAMVSHIDEQPSFITDYIHVHGHHLADFLRTLSAEAAALRKDNPAAGSKPSKGTATRLSQIGLADIEQGLFTSMARCYAEAKKPIIIVDTAVTGMTECDCIAPILDLAKLKTGKGQEGQNLLILKPAGNSIGAWRAGIAAQSAPEGKDHLKGGIVLMGEELALDEDLLGRINSSEFVAVLTSYALPEWLDRAHVLIPKPMWMEQDGTFMSLDALEKAYRCRTLVPPEGVRPTWESLAAMEERIGMKNRIKSWDELRKKTEEMM